MWMMPLHLHINQKSDYDMMITKKKHLIFSGKIYRNVKHKERICRANQQMKSNMSDTGLKSVFTIPSLVSDLDVKVIDFQIFHLIGLRSHIK